MTTTIEPAAIMAAVYHAFHRADPCHCHGDAKLSEGEVLAAFIKKGLIAPADTPHQDALAIDNLYAAEAISYNERSSFRLIGIGHLPELRYWTLNQVRHTPGVGAKKADNIERLAAKFGVLLADGDPALLEEVKQAGEISSEERTWRGSKPRKMPGTPEEIRTACADDLLTLAGRLIADGGSLARIAGKVAGNSGQRGQAGDIRRYLTRDQYGAAHVRAITKPFLDMVDRAKPRRRPGKSAPAAAPDNVITMQRSAELIARRAGGAS